MKTGSFIGLLAILSAAPVLAGASQLQAGGTGPGLYFCAASDAYYPYAASCPGGWQIVQTNSNAGLAQGMAAYRKQDFAAALRAWRPYAILGNALAQFTLGTMYEKGNGVTQDYSEAVKWYRLAADKGRAEAQNNLGGMVESGLGVAQDYNEAAKWYRLAAGRGYPYAQVNLAHLYENGQGVARDYAEAVKWYRLAANAGDAGAQHDLAALYADGKGVQQSRVIAYALYNLSALQVPDSGDNTAAMPEQLSASMTAAELAEGQVLLQEMRKPGMLLTTLDRYVKKSD